MKRGRKPTPNVLKIMNGSRAPQHEESRQPEPGAPEMPSDLDDEAKAEWVRLVPALEEIGILSKVDRTQLVMMCEAWSMYRSATDWLAKHGVVMTYSNAYGDTLHKPSPYLAIQSDAFGRYSKLAASFGLSPSSRQSLRVTQKAEEAEEKQSKADKLLG